MSTSQLIATVEHAPVVFSIENTDRPRLAVDVPTAVMKRYLVDDEKPSRADGRGRWPENVALQALEERELAVVNPPLLKDGSQHIVLLSENMPKSSRDQFIMSLTISRWVMDVAKEPNTLTTPRSYLEIQSYSPLSLWADTAIDLRIWANVQSPSTPGERLGRHMNTLMSLFARDFGIANGDSSPLFASNFSKEPSRVEINFHHPGQNAKLHANETESDRLKVISKSRRTHPALPFLWVIGLVGMGEAI